MQEDTFLRMPVARRVTWQGECIEGKGVEPDFDAEKLSRITGAGVRHAP